MTDLTPMPYGAHQGKPMQDVPAIYLIYIYENEEVSKEVKSYIEDNMETLQLEVKQGMRK